MLFTGLSEHAIDPKARLAIPAKYRHQWDPVRDGAAWYCLPWPTGHLRLYTEATFKRLAEAEHSSLTPSALQAEIDTTLFANAERLEMDTQGRILIPRWHLEATGLRADQPVMVVGARDRLEVRDRAAWNAEAKARLQAMPDLIARRDALRAAEQTPRS